jgi:RNA polymerase sigma-70 factor (ECF subfamily)
MANSSDFARLYAAEHGRLSRIVRRIAGSPEAAEDIAHDAFVKLSGRDVGEADIGLLVRTAQNLARDMKRAERVRASYAAEVTVEQLGQPVIGAEQQTAARQELDALFTALKSLPERTQRIFLLSRLDEMTYPQIAKKLGVSVSTIEKEMVSALEFCRVWRAQRDLF